MSAASRSGVLAVVLAIALAGCADDAAPPARPALQPDALATSIRTEALVEHLAALDRIAVEHNGNRAAGTAGYDASVDYVADKLRSAGFDVETPEFEMAEYDVRSSSLEVAGRPVEARPFEYSPATPEVRARLEVLGSQGCKTGDYDGRDVTGAVVLVGRGSCPFVDKERTAADRGAAALLVSNDRDGEFGGTLDPSAPPRIPTVGVTREVAGQLAGDVVLKIDASTENVKSRNVIAQTKTGSADNVVVAGAHLDSVPAGAGINDNGSGVAAILETALRMGPEPEIANRTRFAFWGGEELGLLGSTDYVEKLTAAQRLDIALYLNFDMIGSPNPGYLTHDGDNSDGVGAPPGPDGSDGIEQVFNGYYDRIGIVPDGADFDGRSDYAAFADHGIPVGGVFSGADENKSADEAKRWGGTADAPFDPNYHSPLDNLANIDHEALGRNAAAVAYGIGVYAVSIDGPDGVPGRADREGVRGDRK